MGESSDLAAALDIQVGMEELLKASKREILPLLCRESGSAPSLTRFSYKVSATSIGDRCKHREVFSHIVLIL